MTSEKRAQKFHTHDASLPSGVVLLIGWIKFPRRHDQSEALPRSGYWHVISMEFLRSFLSRHFAGKPVVVSPNVGCFLRLMDVWLITLFEEHWKIYTNAANFKNTVMHGLSRNVCMSSRTCIHHLNWSPDHWIFTRSWFFMSAFSKVSKNCKIKMSLLSPRSFFLWKFKKSPYLLIDQWQRFWTRCVQSC